MTTKENFTVGRIEGFTCPEGKGEAYFWCGKIPSLGVKVSKSGLKTYVFQAKRRGQTIRKKIGGFPSMPLAQAQARAITLLGMVNSGVDFREVEREAKEALKAKKSKQQAEALAVRVAWNDYLEIQRHYMDSSHIKRSGTWGEAYFASHLAMALKGGEPKLRGKGKTKRGALYPLLEMKLAEVDVDVVLKWLRAEAKARPTTARQAYSCFRAFWKWCAFEDKYSGIIKPFVFESPKIKKEVPSKGSRRANSLDKDSLALWFSSVNELSLYGEVEGGIRAEGALIGKAYLIALMLTGARREEMAQLKWADISKNFDSIHVKDKVRLDTGRDIPLTPYLASLIKGLPRRENNPYVFSSNSSKTGYLAEPSSLHNRALALARESEPTFPHVTLHDLRRTFITNAEWLGLPTGVIAQIVGHSPSAVAEKHYINRSPEYLLEKLSEYEAWILKQAGIKFSTNSRIAKKAVR